MAQQRLGRGPGKWVRWAFLSAWLVFPAVAWQGAGAAPVGSTPDEYARPETQGGFLGGPQMSVLSCIPTCSEVDGRFLAIAAGPDLASLSREEQNFQILVPQGLGTFEMGIFDGDCGGVDGAGDSHWDRGVAPFELSVYVDPTQDGSSTTLVLGPVPSSSLENNGWSNFSVPRLANAQHPSGLYSYRVEIKALDPATTQINAFKLRSEGVLSIRSDQQPFGFYASITGLADARIIFPDFPDLENTTYDGTFDLPFAIQGETTQVSIWDGDFDFGSFDGQAVDDDDLNTPGSPYLPSWATAAAIPEEVCPSHPSDDNEAEGIVRSPSVYYTVTSSGGQVFTNSNPSGNLEWETFVVSTTSFDPTVADATTGKLSDGLYRLRVEGLDMQNMGFLHLPGELLCVDGEGVPCDSPLASGE